MNFRRIFPFLLALVPSLAWAQGGPVQQSGPVTPGHAPAFITNGVVGDGGSAQNGKLKELGITNTGTPLCINDAPTTSPYHQLCLGANALGGGLLSYNAYGGASPLPFECLINGVKISCLGASPPPPPAALGCASIMTQGGAADNATDNTMAFAATAAIGGRPCIYFPPGQYYFASPPSVTVGAGQSIMIRGDGPEISLLRFAPGSNGFNITLTDHTSTFHVRDLSLLASGPPQSGANAVAVNKPTGEVGAVAMQSDVLNVTFRGSDGYAKANGWQGGVTLRDVTNVNFINDGFFGTLAGFNGSETAGVGIYAVGLPGAISSGAGAQYNVIASTFEFLNIGIGFDYNVQGFAVSNSTFVLNNIGVFSSPGAAQAVNKAALQFIGNNCNNFVACVQDNTDGGIPFAIYLGNVVFSQRNSVGFQFVGNNTIVADNTIWGALGSNPNSIGIYASYGSAQGPTSIHGNTIGAHQPSGSNIGTGIKLSSYSQSVVVSNNWIDPATVTVPIENDVTTFGNHNFISGQPVNVSAQQITGAASNIQTISATVSAGNPSVVSAPAHGLLPGTAFQFATVGGLGGITAGQTYYVSGGNTFTPNSFTYSAAFAGPDVNTSGTSSTLSLSTTPQLTRLTVPSTAGFVTGAYATINGLQGVPCNFVTPVWVVDATHLDLSTCLWSGGTFGGGGTISTLP